MPKWIFLIPFPSPRIAPGCQRGHYAKPSPEVQRAHGGLISRPPPLRDAPRRSEQVRLRVKVWAIPFPSRRSCFLKPRMWKRRPVSSVFTITRSVVFIPTFPPSPPSAVFPITPPRHMLHPSGLNHKTWSAFGRSGDTSRKKLPPTRRLFSASIDSSFLFSDLQTQPDLWLQGTPASPQGRDQPGVRPGAASM